MGQEQATNGQNPGQEAPASKEGDAGGGGGGGDSLADLKARFDLLQETVSDFTKAVADSRRQQTAPPPQVDDIDDDEPLTGSKVKKIVQSSVAAVAAQNRTLTERQQWDAKAKSEFPLDDPKFQMEVRREWREQVQNGLDPNHPRALFNVAQITARTWGGKKPSKTQDAETTLNSETPLNPSPRNPRSGGSSQSKISDDDPRVRFYAMKHGKNPDKIKAFKEKLGAQEAPRRGR